MEETFTYNALERRIRAVIPDQPIVHKNPWARVALAFGIVGLLGSLLGSLIPSADWRVWVVFPGLILEILGFGIYFAFEFYTEIPWFRKAKDEFASLLDHNYEGYLELVAWLRRYPSAEIRARLDYLRLRQDVMKRRMGLVVGATERLGILPVAAAVYLQLKDLDWPPQIGFWQGLLAFLLLALYALCHWISEFKFKLDFYVGLLELAVNSPRKAEST